MEQLKMMREAMGMPQHEVARILGITRQAYSNYEAGNRSPNYEALTKLSALYQVPTDFLLGQPPFNCIALIEQDRTSFFAQTQDSEEDLRSKYNIEKAKPQSASLPAIVRYLGLNYDSIEYSAEGKWILQRKEEFSQQEDPLLFGEEVWNKLSNRQRYLLTIIAELPDAGQAEILHYAEYVRATQTQ